jgi:hypothetical protein
VTNQHYAFAEIDRMKLGEGATDDDAVHQQHGYAGCQVGFTAYRNAGRGQESSVAATRTADCR